MFVIYALRMGLAAACVWMTPEWPLTSHVSPLVQYVSKGIICSTSGFILAALCSTILDIFPVISHRWKIQKNCHLSRNEYVHASMVSLFNLLVSSWLIYPIYIFSNLEEDDNSVIYWREGLKLLICAAVIDIWFYCTHRVLHHYPILYSRIHKIHHRFSAPCAWACFYAHPIEFALGNVLGVALGPVITGTCPSTTYFWFALATIISCTSHAGYTVLDSYAHDLHHSTFQHNFGTEFFMDRLFSTKV